MNIHDELNRAITVISNFNNDVTAESLNYPLAQNKLNELDTTLKTVSHSIIEHLRKVKPGSPKEETITRPDAERITGAAEQVIEHIGNVCNAIGDEKHTTDLVATLRQASNSLESLRDLVSGLYGNRVKADSKRTTKTDTAMREE